MGISELLRKFGPIIEAKHISDFKNKTAAIDISNWLYKGLYACAAKDSNDNKSNLYLNYPLKMIALLKAHDICPIVIFDGKTIKEKASIEEARKEARESNIERANYLKNAGNEDESKKYLKRALKIKSRMINSLIEMLMQLDIKVIVAPYEADSQISYLVRKKYADFAISEDSDLIALGVNDIVMKLTPEGSCMNLNLEKFRNSPIENYSDEIIKGLKNLSYVNFLELCVMNGCDYIPSIKGFGIKTGLALFEKHKKLENVFHEMKFIEKFKSKIPENYLENAKKAVCLFFYQTVFDPEANKLVSLHSSNYEEEDDLDMTYSKEYINKFVSHLLYKKDSEKYDSKKLKSKKIFKEIKESINQELNSEEKDFPISEDDLFQLFGENFENAHLYCNGLLDIKTNLPEKKLEPKNTFFHYKNKFNQMLFFTKKEVENANKNKALHEQNENNLFFNNDKGNNNDNSLDEEEILRLISEDIENEATFINSSKDNSGKSNYLPIDKYIENNNEGENQFLNRKRFNSNNNNNPCNETPKNNNNDEIGKSNFSNTNNNNNKVKTHSPSQTPENNKRFNAISAHKSEVKGAKNLLDLINKEKYNESNNKNLALKNNLHLEAEILISDSPLKYY